jgi:integrase-like protein
MTVLSVLDAAGRRRSPATLPGYRAGRSPRNKGTRYPADPPTVEEIVAVMRHAPDDRHGWRVRAMIVVLWRGGLRIQEALALALAEHDLDPRRGSILVRHGKGGRRREVGMDEFAWEQLRLWLSARAELPLGPLFCVIDGPTRGRPWSGRDRLGGRQSVAAHHLCDRGGVGRAAARGGEDLSHVLEVGGSQHAGGGDRQELGLDAAAILEPVDLAARDAHRLARAELTGMAVDRPGASSLEAIDRLLKRIVAVSHGHLRSGGDHALEHRHAAAGIVGVDEEVDRDRTYLDGCCGWRVHSSLRFPIAL